MTAVTGELLVSVANNSSTTQIVLPDKLSGIKRAEEFPSLKLKWNSSEEVLSILISFDKHNSWFSQKVPTRPPNGSMFLFDRPTVKDCRKDGYTWKKRTSSSSSIREDHCKLKVYGVNCLNVVYTHSAIVPTFHRRIYWLLQNPDIVLVHYLNLIDDLSEQHTYAFEKQKANISCQINSIFSGVEEHLIPKFEITEEEETDSQAPGRTPQPKKPQNDKKRFKITITPAIKDDLHSVITNQRGKRKKDVTIHTEMQTSNNRLPGNQQVHSNQQLLSNTGQLQGGCNQQVPSNQQVHSNQQLLSNTGQLQGGCNQQVPSNQQLLSNTGQLQGVSNNRAIQSTVVFSPVCNVRPLQNQRNSPVRSYGSNTQNNDLPTSLVRFPGTVTSCLSVPVGYLQTPRTEHQHASTESLVLTTSNNSAHPQPVYANSVSVGTQPLLFFSSASIPAAVRAASTLNLPTSNNVVEMNYSVANTLLNGNTTVTTTSTGSHSSAFSTDATNTMNSALDFQFRPLESPQGNNGPFNMSLENKGPSHLSQLNNGPVGPGPFQGTSSVPSNVPMASNTHLAQHVNNDVAPSGNIPIIGPSRTQFQDSLPETRSTNQQPTELSSSPSSDYGSLLSESGTRFSGSESMSSEIGSSSCENGFDGPFRLPLPIMQSNRGSTSLRHTTILSSSHTLAHPECANKVGGYHRNNTLPCGNDADCYHRDTSTLDSNPVDLTFDFPELQSLDELDYDELNIDLNSVLGEYFNSPTSIPQSKAEGSSVEGQLQYSTANSLNDARLHGKESDKRSDVAVGSTHETMEDIPSSSSSGTSTIQITTASTLQVNNEATTPSDTCRTPVNDIVMTTIQSPYPQTCHSDNLTTGPQLGSSETEECHDETAGNSDSNNHTYAPEMNSNSSLLPAVMLGSACISDFSPEWSYSEGGVKILVTGEWTSTDISYTCLFDGCSVEATLVQVGVLRCYCPPHEPGLVTLQVACNGFIVSNACVFEYRAHDSPGDLNTHHEWLAMDDARFKLALLDRLERLESRLGVNASGEDRTHSESRQRQCRTFEERILVSCKALFEAATSYGVSNLKRPYRGMTLMHLSAALGFFKVLREMVARWQDPQTSELIRQELDPSRKDEFSCTSLMWACALGQRTAVAELLCCHANALLVPDACGRLPLQVARDRGYFEIVDCIEEFMMSSPGRRLVFNLEDEDEEEALESNIPSPSRLTTSSTSGSAHHNSPPLPPHSQAMSLETNFTDRACSPMHVEEANNGSVLLNQALVQIHEMINEAERQADIDHQNLAVRLPLQLSPVQEEPVLLNSPGGWGSSGNRFRSFSSASSQSSPLTPSSKSSLSPGSPAFLNSPHSSPGVPPDTKEFHEFLCTSKKLLEKNFSELTLTDREQQELYQAALIIQEAYRSYKIRRQQQEQEMQAAVLIQNHYRRYKQFLLYKKRTHAALIIQNQYRAYREHEQFKKSRRAAAIIQNQFRIYRQRRQSQKRRDEHKSKQQEARFMRQSSNRSNTNV